MEIYIMRHGEPDIQALSKKITAKEFLQLLKSYKRCGIMDTSRPKNAGFEKFSDFNAIISSDLRRSVESASLFSSRNAFIVDPLFGEIEGSFIQVPFIKLTARTWSNIFILLWFARVFELNRAFREGKTRAATCADILAGLAQQYGKVLLVGHGFMNAYIAKELIGLGWHGPRIPGKKYWEYSVYKKTDVIYPSVRKEV